MARPRTLYLCAARAAAVGTAVLVAAALAGCAHAQDSSAATGEADAREVTVLRERVSRLERRLSDLDAQMALLTDKVAAAPRDSVSVGSTQGYVPAPTTYAPPPPASSETWTGYQAAEPSYQAPSYNTPAYTAPGTRSIDLGPAPPRAAPPVELPPEEPVDEESVKTVQTVQAVAKREVREKSGPPRGDVQVVYDWGRAQMEEGRYLEAIAAFEDVLTQHTGHHLADNALYWVGVCHLERGEPKQAIDTWKALPLRFPSSPKMPDSLYGMALAHEELGEPVLAETLYGQLVQQFPKAEKTSEAKKALKRLSGSPDAPR